MSSYNNMNMAWIGPPGSGKKTEVNKALKHICTTYNIDWNPQNKFWKLQPDKGTEGGMSTDAAEEKDDDTPTGLPYQSSFIHFGFDMYRMSMKDKIYLGSILDRWTNSQNLLLAHQGAKAPPRILVLYHAHVMSDESLLLIHHAVESLEGNILIWMTSEEPLPQRLADSFFTVPVGGTDRLGKHYKDSLHLDTNDAWIDWFQARFAEAQDLKLSIDTVPLLRSWVYTCLQRNLRWQQLLYYWFNVILEKSSDLPKEKVKQLVEDLLKFEATAGFSSLPSYRIPIAWEAFFLSQVKILSA
jgi:hypothetical protein